MARATDTRLTSLATLWQNEAQRRRQMSAGDVGADVLEFCASELAEELRNAADADEELSVAQYAALHGRSPSTVRRWCQLQYITARPVGRGYVIRRGEPTPRLQRQSA